MPPSPNSFVYISVSDGVGVGMVANGELVRGHDHIAGEFGHMPLNLDGPRCMCGASRAAGRRTFPISATLSRYFGRNLSKLNTKIICVTPSTALSPCSTLWPGRSGGDMRKAIAAISGDSAFLGLGLGTIVKVDQSRLYLSWRGEITTAWDLIESTVREANDRTGVDRACARTPRCAHVSATLNRHD